MLPAALATPWESLRPFGTLACGAQAVAGTFALPSAQVDHAPAAVAYAAASLTAGRGVGEAVTDLMHRVHDDFEYDRTATVSTVADILERRAGVCQDFAHLAIACLRAHGLAARYVSGYLGASRPRAQEASSAPTPATRGSRCGSATTVKPSAWRPGGRRPSRRMRGRDYDVPRSRA